MIDDELFHEGIQCFVDKLEYDFAARVGTLYIPRLSATDMRGTIDAFKAIDPNVTSIRVFCDGVVDALYFFNGGKWHARSRGRSTRCD